MAQPWMRTGALAAALLLGTALPACAESDFEFVSPAPSAAPAPAADSGAGDIDGPMTPRQLQDLLKRMPAMAPDAPIARTRPVDAELPPRRTGSTPNTFSSLPYDGDDDAPTARRGAPARSGGAAAALPDEAMPLGLDSLLRHAQPGAPAAPGHSPRERSAEPPPIAAATPPAVPPPPREQRSPGFVLIPAGAGSGAGNGASSGANSETATAAPAAPEPKARPPATAAKGPPMPIVIDRAPGAVQPVSASVEPPAAPAGDGSWDSCIALLKELPAGVQATTPAIEGCEPVALRNDCDGARYMVLCKSGADGRGCETTDAPVDKGGVSPFQICMRGNYLMQHAACQDQAGCDNFANRPLLSGQ